MSSVQTRLDKCVAYLQNKQLFECAKAIEKAAGQVHCYQRQIPTYSKYSNEMNARLVESLWAMNSDPHCDTRNIKHTRSLIEAWREMNGMSPDNYDLPPEEETHSIMQDVDDDTYIDEYDSYDDEEYEDEYDEPGAYEGADIVIDIDPEAYDAEEMDDTSVEDCILSMVDRGGYLSYEAICDEMAECDEDEVTILDALKELVRQGYFEVTSRNPYTGQIDMVLKIR